MARKIIHQLVDDIDGTVLDAGAGETVSFSLDGTAYEIDVSDQNAAELRDAFAPFISAGRSVSTARSSSAKPRRSAGGSSHDLAAVRAWARDNGLAVSERGRIAASVLEAYDAAH